MPRCLIFIEPNPIRKLLRLNTYQDGDFLTVSGKEKLTTSNAKRTCLRVKHLLELSNHCALIPLPLLVQVLMISLCQIYVSPSWMMHGDNR